MVKHQKVYNGLGEKEQRFQIFMDNVKFIDDHNDQNHTYKLGLNQFADMTNEEHSMYLGTRSNDDIKNKIISQQYAYNSGDILSESVDWRWAVGPIKNQGNCGKFVSDLINFESFSPASHCFMLMQVLVGRFLQ
ncbi:hypothetical protein KIW84_042589 [Lathyrus oleraceus]|uniref:Cathepsin propeptide inhibitor domain-containing protein n=1 Tax=Pisum sativum TaxID=3888 RepID=A0A9D4XDB7_PEA|nr:hypothetical protein KIW84_042589 [Pisum sativum]